VEEFREFSMRGKGRFEGELLMESLFENRLKE
jgi:hypothetical protein